MKSSHLKVLSLSLASATLISLVACSPNTLPGNTVGVPVGAGSEKASITGSVVKADMSPARNATMVLIQRTGGTDRDVQIVRSDNNGQYRFGDIPAGEYRLAFVLQTESERKNNTTKYYNPSQDAQSGQYFSFMTTGNFTFGGNSGAAFQVPQMNVGWVSGLEAHGKTFDSDGPINFNWTSVEGATSYIVDIRDSNNNPFYKSGELKSTSFSWTDLKGNQGSNNGVAVKPGAYFYIVNARLNRSNVGNGPTPTYGGTALASFNVR